MASVFQASTLCNGGLAVSVIVLVPLLVILVLLVMRKHMIVAGLCGAVVAMLIGNVGLSAGTKIVNDALPGMLTMLVPIMYSATALAIAKTGGFEALLGLCKRAVGEKLYLVAAAVVLIQALATYAAGLGAGNTMAIGPLAFAVAGAIPQVVAGMAIVTAASFETSPASAETATVTKIAGIDVNTYVDTMFPFTLFFWLIGTTLAAYGVKKHGSLLTKDAIRDNTDDMPMEKLVRNAVAPIYFIMVVVGGKYLNAGLGYAMFTPVFNMISALIIAVVMTREPMDKMAENLIQGSAFILTRLFAIGVFLGFINVLSQIGTFKYIAQLTASAPSYIFVPLAIVAGFVVAVPAGAYSVGVISLILPLLAEVGLTPLHMGFVALAIGMGTQMSPVQINVAALSQTFEMDITQVIRNNAPYLIVILGVICAMGVIF